jgi:glyoxylase-like metal-dependent hydrolase (beta-lactamase superfamily II)
MKPFPEIENVHPLVRSMPGFPYLISANVYAIGTGPITLIDTGPKFSDSIEILEKQLGVIGFDFSDIERILFTHAHVDHTGLAMKIMEAADRSIECFIHVEDRWRILKGNHQEQIWNQETEKFCIRMNMPREEIEKARKRFYGLRQLFDPLDRVSNFKDGDVIQGNGFHLEVIHTPGHTSGGCCFYERDHKILFSGDSVIKHITPIPLVTMKPGVSIQSPYRSLNAFCRSMERLRHRDIRYVFPGHGEYIDDFHGLVEQYFRHHHQRMKMIWCALEKGSMSIYELVRKIFPKVPGGNPFLAVVEIFAHLEMLISEKKVELTDPGPPELYHTL